MQPAFDPLDATAAALHLEGYPEVRRLLLLTLVLLSLWFSDVRGPLSLDYRPRRRLGDDRGAPSRSDRLPELIGLPAHARRSQAPALALPRRARRR